MGKLKHPDVQIHNEKNEYIIVLQGSSHNTSMFPKKQYNLLLRSRENTTVLYSYV